MPDRPPVLIHIGYHKSGTSWLQRLVFENPAVGLRWLGKSERRHPVRRLVATRPFEFDADAARAEFEPLLEEIRAEDLVPVVSFERFTGHPFSGGYDSKEIASRLAEVFPGASILVVIREQRSMILSTYKQYVRAGGPCSLGHFLKPPASHSMRVPLFDARHFEYHHLLRHYQALFGPEAVLILAYEQLVEDPVAFAARICEFMGRPVGPGALDSAGLEQRTNVAFSAPAIAVKRRLNRLTVRSELNPAPLLASRALERFAVRSRGRAVDALVPRRVAARGEASLRRTGAKFVGDRYTESNRITAQLAGIDLERYGWIV